MRHSPKRLPTSRPYDSPDAMVFKDYRVIALLLWAVAATIFVLYPSLFSMQSCPYVWHGGSPAFPGGSCWCGKDTYCMCTPSLAIDAIIEVLPEGGSIDDMKIALVRRRDPPRNLHATPGGFVDVGETVEAATLREVKEETNLDLDHLEQFRIYSDPSRDMRRHTVSAAFRCRVKDASNMHRGDDAKGVDLIPIKEILNLHFAFDHRTILTDYLTKYHPQYLPSDASK